MRAAIKKVFWKMIIFYNRVMAFSVILSLSDNINEEYYQIFHAKLGLHTEAIGNSRKRKAETLYPTEETFIASVVVALKTPAANVCIICEDPGMALRIMQKLVGSAFSVLPQQITDGVWDVSCFFSAPS